MHIPQLLFLVSTLPLLLLLLLTPPVHSSLLPLSRQSSTQCPIRLPLIDTSGTRIVGGEKAEDYIRTHMISFHREGCGGSLISPTWIVTAAHCFVTTSSTPTLAGSNSNNGIPLRIKQVYDHPAYDFPKNDITLVELEEPAPVDARFFAVNGNPNVPAEGEFARVAGYGHTDEYNSDNVNSELYQVDVPVVTTADCIAAFEPLDTDIKGKIVRSMHICAGYEDGKCDSCTQDSGGPLFVYAPNGGLVQIAIVSFGYGCARPGLPGGYVRLSKYRNWMRRMGATFDEVTVREPVFLEGFGPSEGSGNGANGGGNGNGGNGGNGANGSVSETSDVLGDGGTSETGGDSGESSGNGGGSSPNASPGPMPTEPGPAPENVDEDTGAEGVDPDAVVETNEAGTVEVEEGSGGGGVSNTVIIVSSLLAGVAFVSAFVFVVWWRRRRNGADATTATTGNGRESQV